jgi:hypothetical protein
MRYEEAIRAKHEFQDSFLDLIECLSAMTSREIELAAARIADRISDIEDEEAKQSSLVAGQVCRTVLNLRGDGELSENKLKRIWYITTKKRQLRRRAALLRREEAINKFEVLAQKSEKQRKRMAEEYKVQLQAWERERADLGFWSRLFKGPSKPPYPNYPDYPVRPFATPYYESEVGRKMDTSELLVTYVVNHFFPHSHYAPEFVDDVSIRETSIKLIESK